MLYILVTVFIIIVLVAILISAIDSYDKTKEEVIYSKYIINQSPLPLKTRIKLSKMKRNKGGKVNSSLFKHKENPKYKIHHYDNNKELVETIEYDLCNLSKEPIVNKYKK